jgi:hypothetical protein
MAKTFTEILKKFEATEANLVKLEGLWREIRQMIPEGIAFGTNSDYDDKCHTFKEILPYLPKIDGWQPDIVFYGLNEIGQTRFDYFDIGEGIASIHFDEEVMRPEAELRKYRFLLGQKRRKLIRDEIMRLATSIDSDIEVLLKKLSQEENLSPESVEWITLREHYNEINTLLGSNARPDRWYDMRRHLRFAMVNDAHDIKEFDWPAIKQGLMIDIYTANDPIPVDVEDLAELVQSKPTGSIPKKLSWQNLKPEEFERLIFALLSTTPDYQNCSWLTKTNAPDKGRDLSVELITQDSLNGKKSQRIIVQCKHYLNTSVSLSDVSNLVAQMKLWEPPSVDFCIIVTSGRFTSDAIAFIDKENQADRVLRIKMWPESHLENLLAARPDLIAQFNLR